MTSPISIYLKSIEDELNRGNATEHTHRPALKTFIESLSPAITATNEPTHVECGAPDFVISSKAGVIGYIETKDVGVNLNQTERSDQIKRYLPAFRNFILTDYLEFRWYVDGALRRTINIASTIPQGSGLTLKIDKSALANLEALLTDFLTHIPEPITSPNILAQRLARLAHLIRDGIIAAFNQNQASETLITWRETFAKILIAGLDKPEKLSEFADMFAQTLAYGLFSARIMDETAETFSLDEAKGLIPETNPFLRDFFYDITGPKLKREPFSTYVDDLVDLLVHSDMDSILANFGKRTRTEDPVVHFYETFLAAYDPKLREMRGVYYTPQPVVGFIVRAVDEILKTKFNLKDGIADSSLITNKISDEKQDKNQHKVLILDPACGTGTFLYNVIDLIRSKFIREGNAGMWSGYVRNHLLPRLYGFEILMAPYAVAHFKLALQLKGLDLPEIERKTWAYDFSGNERLNIFLTNTLEEPHEYSDLPLFMSAVANETKQANRVKRELPIMVILGNPPYSKFSSNVHYYYENGKKTPNFIGNLLLDYFKVGNEPLGEKNPKWLQDDYVKFIRWAQWRIQKTGFGVLGYVTNHGFLNNPTFRGMRYSLMQTFDEMYILNLHGNSKRQEHIPDKQKDENVFDIQQGVCINIFIKSNSIKPKPSTVYYSDLWGVRDIKYDHLTNSSINSTKWTRIEPNSPFFLFIKQDKKLLPEYNLGWPISKIFKLFGSTVTTARNDFSMSFIPKDLTQRIQDLINKNISDDQISSKYCLKNVSYWNVTNARNKLSNVTNIESYIRDYCYRPFDFRYVFFHESIVERPRLKVMNQMINNNVALLTHRPQSPNEDFNFIYCTRMIGDQCVAANKSVGGGNSFQFPLFIEVVKDINEISDLFPTNNNKEIKEKRICNLDKVFISDFSKKVCLSFGQNDMGDLINTFGPIDILNYIYSILHSPTYRIRYSDFLKTDFPRVPITSNLKSFQKLCKLGKELIDLHLLESHKVSIFITTFPMSGDHRVEKGHPVFKGIKNKSGRVYINPTQYFEGVPEDVWNFHIGGYQVLEKWLKDRRGRLLTYDDLTHYQKVVVALSETIRIMKEIDKAIPEWPIK